ncbi:transcriptional regulator [Pseudomonas sp. BRG-100]|uniref:histone-like nucleoid-structuring protein, MvaT/MvaU family n=1 Tax=Pseudomonas sp. BRG-100 TaxID=1524267 RepID=UPI0004E6570E|nr:histone-like nucleoid-structuring protein, MvaT/MvaU family [Pseudomonas sp. BRG-100]KFF42185.1 transcriptional regulator [Pseudomonas sp. BRG-100]
MSRIAELRQLEKNIADQLQDLESLKADPRIQKELEFESKLRTLLGEYSFSLRTIIGILDPHSNYMIKAGQTQEKKTRKQRATKVYKNPHTGEVVETKGGNHAMLKAWKTEHGSEEVESWLASQF